MKKTKMTDAEADDYRICHRCQRPMHLQEEPFQLCIQCQQREEDRDRANRLDIHRQISERHV